MKISELESADSAGFIAPTVSQQPRKDGAPPARPYGKLVPDFLVPRTPSKMIVVSPWTAMIDGTRQPY